MYKLEYRHRRKQVITEHYKTLFHACLSYEIIAHLFRQPAALYDVSGKEPQQISIDTIQTELDRQREIRTRRTDTMSTPTRMRADSIDLD